jgi:hypothetical protein
LESVEGIVLGPQVGFVAAFLGSSIARMARPDVFWMFGIVAEPLSVLVAGFLSAGKWKPVCVAYAIMLSAYFIHPLGRELPLWTILDVLVALLLIYPAAKLSRSLFTNNLSRLSISLCLIAFVSIATDSLVRVFLLVPCGFYSLFPEFFGNFNELYVAFVGAAASSYIEDAIVVAVSLLAGVPILVATSKLRLFQEKNRKKTPR